MTVSPDKGVSVRRYCRPTVDVYSVIVLGWLLGRQQNACPDLIMLQRKRNRRLL